MRVGIDVRPALSRKTGVGRYLLGLAPALARLGHDVVAFSASWKERLDAASFPGCRTVDRRIPVRLLDAAWARGWGGPLAFDRLAGRVDVCHAPIPLPLPAAAARVITIHDLYFLRHPETVTTATRAWIDRLARAVAEADAVICVSEATAQAAVALLGSDRARLDVVHHGLEPGWLVPADAVATEAALDRLGVRRPFILAVGTLEVRKNYPRLIAALAQLAHARRPAPSLVIAGGPGPDSAAVDAAVRAAGPAVTVRLLGYQDDPTLRALYRAAAALAMPSFDEGFGFPLLEAMASGCPVLAAKAGALPEVGGDAAIYAEPTDVDAIADGLARLLDGGGEVEERRARARARAAQFTWEAAARKTAAVYERACRRRAA